LTILSTTRRESLQDGQNINIFLTGGTGFIGQRLAATMRERGWSVEALVRDPDADQAIALAEMGCTLVRGDVTQAEDLAALMSHADDVVHNAGVYELGGRKSTIERMRSVNVAGTRHVSEAAKAADFAKTVYVSSVVAIDPALHEPAETRPVEDRSTRGRARVPGSRAPTGHSDAQTAWWDQTTTRHSAFGIRHSAFGIRHSATCSDRTS
jgi:nucleoside-diphosphate-sugar epimerase